MDARVEVGLGVVAFGLGVVVGRRLAGSSLVAVGLSVVPSLPEPLSPETFDPADPLVIYATQRRLAYLGYDPGVYDGTVSPATSVALQHFQANERLPVTGAMDRASVARARDAVVAVAQGVIAPQEAAWVATLGDLGYRSAAPLRFDAQAVGRFQRAERLRVASLGSLDVVTLSALAHRAAERGVPCRTVPTVPFVLGHDAPAGPGWPVVNAALMNLAAMRVGPPYDAAHPYRLGDEDSTGRSARLRAVQTTLDDLGYGPLLVDGLMGPLTAAVVARFQATRGVTPVDGKPGIVTRRALGLG